MTAAPHIVGVDVGSSSARAVALDADGVVTAVSIARYSAAYASVSGQVDPAMWLSGFQAAVSGLGVGTPAALAIGGYGPCTVSSTGEAALTFRYPVGDPSNPRDQHAAQIAELRRLSEPDIEPVLQWDWLIARLGGRSGIQSVWPGDQPLSEFGEPVPVGTTVGTTSGEFGLAAGIPLVPGSNDGYLTAWAAGIDRPGLGFDPGGVTGGLGVAVAADRGDQTASYGIPSAAAGVQIVGGPVAAHGAMLEWWAGLVGRGLEELVHAAASVAPGADGTKPPFARAHLSKNGAMSTTRSRMIGRLPSGPTRMRPCRATRATWVRQVQRGPPLTVMAHEPHMPTRQAKR